MKIIYRAEDGKEFEKKTDCLLYERTLNLYYENTIQKDKIRRNFADALSEYEVNEIARILEYGLSKSDLSESWQSYIRQSIFVQKSKIY